MTDSEIAFRSPLLPNASLSVLHRIVLAAVFVCVRDHPNPFYSFPDSDKFFLLEDYISCHFANLTGGRVCGCGCGCGWVTNECVCGGGGGDVGGWVGGGWVKGGGGVRGSFCTGPDACCFEKRTTLSDLVDHKPHQKCKYYTVHANSLSDSSGF